MSAKSATQVAVPIPANDDERLGELHGLNLLDTAAELRFDRYTSLVADVFGFPVVLVTLVDRERQWFKSSRGLDFRETTRDVSFCAHAICQQGVMVVRDARADPRFADNPLVTGPPHIRFYAGAVVHGPKGQPLGTLCVIDHKPREFGDRNCSRLRQFADLIEQEIHHCRDLDEVRASVMFTAYADPLTRLPNRRLLLDRLAKLLELAAAEHRQVAVLVCDVAGMRMVNQGFGTEVGDELLMQVGERLRLCCPPAGTTARLQSDEFALIFPVPPGGTGHVDAVADQMRKVLDDAYTADGREYYLGVRIGGSVYPDHGATPAALIDRAAAALRFAGDGTPGAIRYFNNEESVGISDRLKIESRLRGALGQAANFHLVYQPIVSLRDGTVAGAEALLRWHDDELGNVGPDLFIPIAEQTGLIEPLGRWVQEEAFRQLAVWAADGSLRIPISINVSAAELLQPEFARELMDRLSASDIAPELVRIEVTEFSIVSDSAVVDANMAQLREGGLHLIIDDFGTGYSSLAYLLRMPISSLKIDRSFVNGLPNSHNEVALTRTIISMARTLTLGTVGEGIETAEQLIFLRDAGCDYVQGYLISKPINPDGIPSLCGRALI